MDYAEHIVDLVGNTPLVKLQHVTEGVECTVLVKLEYLNPGGSAKDRIARRIIDAAEESGDLKPGGTIVEPTSGNTGVGLALVAQQRGYKCVFVLPDKVGEDKIDVLRAYGAEIVMTPTSVAPDSPESYYSVSDRLAEEIPGAFKPNQYENPNGPRSHYETTGPEIWRDTDGRITHFVAGVGTGGTITGTGRYLRDVSDDRVRIVGIDPEGSVYSGGTGRPYLVEGVGEDIWPGAYDPKVPHEIVAVDDAESFAMTRRLAREEGILVGGSSGMAVAGALRVAKGLPADAVMVVLLPDGGRGYLSKIFNDSWMRSYGFSDVDAGETVADVLDARRAQGPAIPDLVHAHPSDTVHDAIATMTEFAVSQLVVLSAEPPVMMGEVVGSVDERRLLDLLFRGEAKPADALAAHIGEQLPLVGIHTSVDDARAALADADALLVTVDGRPHTVLTRQDLVAYLAR
ncbi:MULTISPECIES: cystathionine beta-synthase [unclassified Microbacterium]|uniref:cystathionine beta-synthase n=1 Tax=unclassified Microbacterium TaxID=2609290 RepID=UPI001DC43921|nr:MULTISPECIES: cystathionine beta-synthase [unclassified Microbacterium]CAH0195622.1 Putative cystathionine beta-synthase Rv1077 [Microbacterium sp. Bi121]HWK78324.1 cystathionine beta-synthase [Microbacterium sp.]